MTRKIASAGAVSLLALGACGPGGSAPTGSWRTTHDREHDLEPATAVVDEEMRRRLEALDYV